MPASKLKNITIFILLLANLFLLVLVLPSRTAQKKQTAQTERQLSSLLDSAGVTLVPDKLPETEDCYCLSLTMSEELQSAAAESLLGTLRETKAQSFEAVYRGQNGQGSIGADGIAVFSFTGLPRAGDLLADSSTRFSSAQLSCTKPQLSADGTSVTAFAAVSGLPVFSAPLTMEYEDGVPARFSGLLLCPEKTVRTNSEECLSAADALLSFFAGRMETGWVGSRILTITQGYTAKITRQSAELTPCWRIETDTGVYLVDGMTAAVTAVTPE